MYETGCYGCVEAPSTDVAYVQPMSSFGPLRPLSPGGERLGRDAPVVAVVPPLTAGRARCCSLFLPTPHKSCHRRSSPLT